MRLARWFSLLAVLAVLVAPALGRAQDDDAPEADDANPENLSKDELDALQSLKQLESYAIEALRAKDYDGSERRYKKLIKRLEADDTVNEPTRRRMQSYAHYNLACTYSLNQQTDDAIKELERSVELGFWGWKHMKKDTDLDNIREEDGFKAALRHGRKLETRLIEEEETKLVAQVTSRLTLHKTPAKGYDFSVTTAAGDEMSLKDLRGKVVVVDVFVPYSDDGDSPEIAALVKLHHEYKHKGVEVLGITPVSNAGNIGNWLDKFVEENEIKYGLAGVRPADASLGPYNDSHGEMRIFFIDKKGTVRGMAKRLRSYETIAQVVDTLLAAPGPKPDESRARAKKNADEPSK
jgi:peroxiredoxin